MGDPSWGGRGRTEVALANPRAERRSGSVTRTPLSQPARERQRRTILTGRESARPAAPPITNPEDFNRRTNRRGQPSGRPSPPATANPYCCRHRGGVRILAERHPAEAGPAPRRGDGAEGWSAISSAVAAPTGGANVVWCVVASSLGTEKNGSSFGPLQRLSDGQPVHNSDTVAKISGAVWRHRARAKTPRPTKGRASRESEVGMERSIGRKRGRTPRMGDARRWGSVGGEGWPGENPEESGGILRQTHSRQGPF
jgi:hypothetical protein